MFGTLGSLLRFLLGFVVMAVCSTILIIAALLLLPFRIARIKICNFYGKVVGRTITWFAGVTPNVSNKDRIDAAMPAIYVSNHTSALDAFVGIWLCPYGACGVFKKEIVRVPFFGWLAYLSGHLLLDRFNKDRAVELLKDTAVFVKKNRLGIWILPEGTRSRDGRLLPFKKGFVHLAIATGFPVVPVILHGAHRNWEKGTFRFNPMTVDIEVLPAIDTSSWKEETAGAHANEVHDLFAKMLRDDQKPAPQPELAAAAAVTPA
ncbi:MAG: lysophospholipid acyltransferase family protein [Myxococcaceae bacterium]